MTNEVRRKALLGFAIAAAVLALASLAGMITGFLPRGGVVFVIIFVVLLVACVLGRNKYAGPSGD